jgi:hypothetical protein
MNLQVNYIEKGDHVSIFERFEGWLVWVSGLGSLGSSFFGRLASPLVMVPVVFTGRFFSSISVDLFYVLFMFMILFFVLSVHIALGAFPLERTREIILPRLLGMGITFFLIPMTFTLIFWAYLVYSILLYFIPKLFSRFRMGDSENELVIFSGLSGAFIHEVSAGLISGVVLYIIRFIGVN